MDYPIHFAEQLSQHLKAFRKTRCLTQAQLAMHLGLTQSRIADIETHPGKVSLENVLKVLAALDVRMLLRDETTESILTATSRKPKTLSELKAMKDEATLKGDAW